MRRAGWVPHRRNIPAQSIATRPRIYRGDFNSTTREDANYNYQSVYYNIAGYSLLNLRLGVRRSGWTGALFVTNALDRHAETELPLSNGLDLPTQRRIALNRPRTIGLDVRFNY
jgi:iron complex outermembrane receptor protein